MLRFINIDASNPKHFEAYQRWQNSDRVNSGWKEKGPEEKHRKYLADRFADPHIMGFVFEWDGELGGYGEMSWVKEDPMGCVVFDLTNIRVLMDGLTERMLVVSEITTKGAICSSEKRNSAVGTGVSGLSHVIFLG